MRKVLVRHGVPKLAHVDLATGQPIRKKKAKRYEHPEPGDLVHVDIKRLGRIPDGGGWRVHGRAAGRRNSRASAPSARGYIHSAVNDHSRLAYSEILPDEQGPTTVKFWQREQVFVWGVGSHPGLARSHSSFDEAAFRSLHLAF